MPGDKNVHVANASGQDIYVQVARSGGWLLTDTLYDVYGLVNGGTELRDFVKGSIHLPETIKTFQDLFQYLKTGAKSLQGTADTGVGLPSVAQDFIEAFKKTSLWIPSGQEKNVRTQDGLSTYTTPSGIAGLLGEEIVILTIVSKDGKQVAQFNTGPDDSWIATNRGTIVRAKYGTIWQEDPYTGTNMWNSQ